MGQGGAAGRGEGETGRPPIRGPAGFFLAHPKKAGLQWSFLKRDYCRTGQSGAKLEKRDYSSAKQKRDYISRKSGTIRRTQSDSRVPQPVLIYKLNVSLSGDDQNFRMQLNFFGKLSLFSCFWSSESIKLKSHFTKENGASFLCPSVIYELLISCSEKETCIFL